MAAADGAARLRRVETCPEVCRGRSPAEADAFDETSVALSGHADSAAAAAHIGSESGHAAACVPGRVQVDEVVRARTDRSAGSDRCKIKHIHRAHATRCR